jgi:hypothetical protein
MREGTISRVMAADSPYGELYDFYSVTPEYVAYHIVHFHDYTLIQTLWGLICWHQAHTYMDWVTRNGIVYSLRTCMSLADLTFTMWHAY